MKKIILTLTATLAVLIISNSCSDTGNVTPENDLITLQFTSEKPSLDVDLKTEWNGKTIYWSDKDKIRMAYTVAGEWKGGDEDDKPKLYQSTNNNGASEVASFNVSGSFTLDLEGEHVFYAVYPGDFTSATDFPDAPFFTITLPDVQTPAEDSFHSSADIMVAKSDVLDAFPVDKKVSLKWNRLVAHAHLTLTNLPIQAEEKLQSIKLIADDDVQMTGSFQIDITTGEVKAESPSNVLTISADNLSMVDGNVTFWAVFMPCTWNSLEVVVDTDQATYTRTIPTIANGRKFLRNARNILSINMSEADRKPKVSSGIYYEKVTSAPVDWSGNYLIVCEAYNYAMNGSLKDLNVSGNYVSVSIDNESRIAQTDQLDKYAFVLTPDSDKYKLCSSSGRYIGCKSNSFNVAGTYKSDTHANGITYDSENNCVVIKGLGGYMLQFNYASNSNRFSYFNAAKTNGAIQLYKRSENLQ